MQHPILFSIVAFFALMVIITLGGYRVFYKPGKFLKQLGRPVIGDSPQRQVMQTGEEPEGSAVVTILRQIGSKVPSSEAEVAGLKVELSRAGIRSDTAVPVFYGIRIVSTLALLGFSLMMQPKMPPNPAMKMALLFFGAAAGWILPKFVLEKKVTARQEILRLSLPDMLDLLVVSVEAGLGLDQALQHVGREL